MANKLDLDTIAKEYSEGRISKEDFLYLHKMLTNPPRKTPPQQPPVLQPPQQAHPRVRAGAAPKPKTVPRRMMTGSAVQQAPVLGNNSNASVFGYVRKHHKEVVALLGTLGIFISMFYNKFQTPPPDQGSSRVVMVEPKEEKPAPRLRTQDVKLIAQLMMEDNSWNKELIDDFVKQWNKLSQNEQKVIKQSDWYFDFSSMLSQQIKTARAKARTGDVAAIYSQQALLNLADSLVFGDDRQAQELLAKVARSNDRIKEKKEVKQEPSVTQEKQQAKPEVKDKTRPVQTASLESKPAKQSEPFKQHKISRKEIEDLINRFTVAFEAGRTGDLAALFADDDYSSSFTSLNQIKKQYKDLFKSTRDRQLDLSSFFWEHDYDEARGTAMYQAKVRMKDANINKQITANLDITLRRLMGKVYITNFKLQDKKTVSSSTKFKKELKKKLASKKKPKHPTPAELQDLVTQYVSAYETGDVKGLMQLFANATWTTSRTGLLEMKQNYEDLFAATSGREVFIKNVRWKYKGDKALGTGDLLLTLHENGNKVKTKKGKIRIVAEKSKDLVRFTQLFHVVE